MSAYIIDPNGEDGDGHQGFAVLFTGRSVWKSQPGGRSAQHDPADPQPADPEAGRRAGRPAVGPPATRSRTDTGWFGVALPSRRLDRASDTHARSGPWSRTDVHGTCGVGRGADIWTSYRARYLSHLQGELAGRNASD